MSEYDIYLNDNGTPVKPKIDGRVSYLEGRVIDVKLFGAKGDGVIDDTAAIQAAFRVAYERGGAVVFFPEGIYVFTRTLFIGNNTTVEGVGSGSVLQRGARSGGNTIFFANYVPGLYDPEVDFYYIQDKGYDARAGNITVRNLTIDAACRVYGVETNTNGLTFYNAENVLIENVSFLDWAHNHAVEFGQAKHCAVIGCTFKGAYVRPDYTSIPEAIQLDARLSNGADTTEVEFYPNTFITIERNWFGPMEGKEGLYNVQGGHWGCAFGSHGPSGSRNVIVRDNTVIGCQKAFIFYSYNNLLVTGNNILGRAETLTPSTLGIEIGAYNYAADTVPIFLLAKGCNDVTITDNNINAYGCIKFVQKNSSVTNGIDYYNNNVKISNNQCYGNTGITLFSIKNFECVNNKIQTESHSLLCRDLKDGIISNNITYCDSNYPMMITFSLGVDFEVYTKEQVCCENITISGNRIEQKGDHSYFIYVEWAKHVSFIGNIFKKERTTQPFIRSGADSSYIYAVGNKAIDSTCWILQVLGNLKTCVCGENDGEAYPYNLAPVRFGSPMHVATHNNNPALIMRNSVRIAGEGAVSDTTQKWMNFGLWDTDSGTFIPRVALGLLTGSFSPSADGVYALGSADRRWSSVYSSTSEINTSDAREKTSVAAPDEALMRAWAKVNFKEFQFMDAVEKKGEEARIHVGVIAQQVAEAFASEGLDASRYALFCYDKWGDAYEEEEVVDMEAVLDENGNEVEPAVTHTEKRLVTPAGDRYGIRYSEALALECAYQRWRVDKLEGKLNAAD